MEKIGFIGTFDKTDFLIYVSRILVEMGKKVLIIDSTVNQKAKYVVPVISPTMSYVTEYEGIDVAVGFSDYNGIKRYLGMPETAALTYDYIMIDMDKAESIESFGIYEANRNYFVTSADLFSLKKGLEVLSGIKLPIQLTKIYFSNMMSDEEDEYLNYLSLGYKIKWQDEKIYFPLQTSDQEVIMENQRTEKIKYKGLSSEYKDALVYLASEIVHDERSNAVKRAFKQLERGM